MVCSGWGFWVCGYRERSLDMGSNLTHTFPRLNGGRWVRRAQVRQRTIFAKLPQCYYLRIGRDVIRRRITISIEMDRIKREYCWLSSWWNHIAVSMHHNVTNAKKAYEIIRMLIMRRMANRVCINLSNLFRTLRACWPKMIIVRPFNSCQPWEAYWERSRFWFLPIPTNLWTTSSNTTLPLFS